MNHSWLLFCERGLYPACGLLLQTTAMLLLGMAAGRLTRRGGPIWQSLVYRATLASVIASLGITAIASGRIPRQVSLAYRIAPGAALSYQIEPHEQAPASEPPPGSASSPAPAVAKAFTAASVQENAASATSESIAPPERASQREGWWLACPIALWISVMLAGLVRHALSRRALARLTHASIVVEDGEALALLNDLAARQRLPAPELRSHPRVGAPFLAGILRPAIYLPADHESQFDAATLRAILAHEMAHIARRDCAWFLLARLTAIILCFQPLIWFLERRMVQASEEACDAAVIALGCPARSYAESLLALVERRTARKQPEYGIGITPLRSSLGRRIRRILDRSQERAMRVPLAARAAVTLFAITVAGFAVIVFCPPAFQSLQPLAAGPAVVSFPAAPWTAPAGYADHFQLCRQHGWNAAAARSVATIVQPVSDWKNLPPAISPQDLDLMKACVETEGADPLMGTITFGSAGPPVSLRLKAERVLSKRPHFFFAEYEIAVWYAKSGRRDLFKIWRDRALEDAPAVLAGRVEREDGSPVAGYDFAPMLTYFRSDSYLEGGGINVSYEDAITDENGCYYLPVFKAMYENNGMSMPGDGIYSALSRTSTGERFDLRRFASDARVGLLPPIVYRKYVAFSGTLAGGLGSEDHPLRVPASEWNVSWQPYPGVTAYEVKLEERIRHGTPGRNESISAYPLEPSEGFDAKPFRNTSLFLKLGGVAPVFNKNHVYQLHVLARRGKEQYADSHDVYFVPLKGMAPLPITKTGIEAAIPHSTVQSMRRENGRLIVLGIANGVLVDNAELRDREIFQKPIVNAATGRTISSRWPTVPFRLEF